MASISVRQNNLAVGNFALVAGVTQIYQNIAFVAQGADAFQASFPGIDAYIQYSIGYDDYTFPANLADIQNETGQLTVAIPASFRDGRHIIKMRVAAPETRSLPIAGRCVAGITKTLPYLNMSVYDGILPYMAITSFATNPPGTPATDVEKLAVINVLKDWNTDTANVVQPILTAIDALDGASSSAEIYQVYLDVLYMRRNVYAPEISHAIQSIFNEVLQWRDI